jgi:hypothetical protein
MYRYAPLIALVIAIPLAIGLACLGQLDVTRTTCEEP